LFIAASYHIHFAEAIMQAQYTVPHHVNAKDVTGGLLVLNGLSWAFGYTGQPQLLTRMMAMRNKKETLQSRWIAIAWTILAYTGAFLIGFIGYKLVQAGALGTNAAIVAKDSEKILPVMVMTLLNPILAGILLSGAVSAMMSTASSQLMVVSSSMTEDLYLQVTKKKIPEKRLLLLNRLLTLGVGVVGFVLAISMKETVYGLVSYAWSGIGASFGPAIVLLAFWKKFSRAGAYASLITGTVSSVIWKTWLVDVTGVSERLASYILAFSLAILFSLLFPENKFSSLKK
jgi:sodium/proline symporter